MKVKYKINRTALGSPWSERDWNDAADHLIFDDHHLFHLNLAKKRSCILRGGGGGGQKALRITGSQTSRRGAAVIIRYSYKWEVGSKKRQNKCYITVECSLKKQSVSCE